MKQIIFFIILVLLFGNESRCQSENQNKQQELLKFPLPPSPNAAALGKFGDIPVGLSTGIPSISIPLYNYECTLHKLSMQISVDYHAGGHKVEDLASNCGLGWVLNAGGVIARTVKGLPDDAYNGYLNTPPLPYYYTADAVDHIEYWSAFDNMSTSKGLTLKNSPIDFYTIRSIQQQMLDGEADIFNFNIGQLSGKFFFRKNGQPELITHSNVLIITHFVNLNGINTIHSFTIINKNSGVKYIFNLQEITSPTRTVYMHNVPEPHSIIPAYTSSWFLTKIISADETDSIKLEYNEQTSNLSYETGFSQSQSFDVSSLSVKAGPLISSVTSLNILTQIQLKNILFPDSTKVNFNYSFPREDYVGDNALTSVEIENGNFTKTFSLAYDYFISKPGNMMVPLSNNDDKKRLKLLSIHQTDGVNSLNPYLFEYNAEKLPPRSSPAQDFWGYYKGGIGSSLIHQLEIPGFIPNYIGNSNRNSQEGFGRACILEKITYPSGGYTKLSYSSNDAFTNSYRIDRSIDSITFTEMGINQFKLLNFANRNNEVVNFVIRLHGNSPPLRRAVTNLQKGATFILQLKIQKPLLVRRSL